MSFAPTYQWVCPSTFHSCCFYGEVVPSSNTWSTTHAARKRHKHTIFVHGQCFHICSNSKPWNLEESLIPETKTLRFAGCSSGPDCWKGGGCCCGRMAPCGCGSTLGACFTRLCWPCLVGYSVHSLWSSGTPVLTHSHVFPVAGGSRSLYYTRLSFSVSRRTLAGSLMW